MDSFDDTNELHCPKETDLVTIIELLNSKRVAFLVDCSGSTKNYLLDRTTVYEAEIAIVKQLVKLMNKPPEFITCWSDSCYVVTYNQFISNVLPFGGGTSPNVVYDDSGEGRGENNPATDAEVCIWITDGEIDHGQINTLTKKLFNNNAGASVQLCLNFVVNKTKYEIEIKGNGWTERKTEFITPHQINTSVFLPNNIASAASLNFYHDGTNFYLIGGGGVFSRCGMLYGKKYNWEDLKCNLFAEKSLLHQTLKISPEKDYLFRQGYYPLRGDLYWMPKNFLSKPTGFLWTEFVDLPYELICAYYLFMGESRNFRDRLNEFWEFNESNNTNVTDNDRKVWPELLKLFGNQIRQKYSGASKLFIPKGGGLAAQIPANPDRQTPFIFNPYVMMDNNQK